MSLRDAIKPYLTTQGYVCPNPVPANTYRGADNQTLFTSEYYILLHRNNELTVSDLIKYRALVEACVGPDKELHRAPGDYSQDEIDDYLGVLAGYAEFGWKVPFTLPLPLFRFPQLVYAWLLNKKVPSILMIPLSILTAIILASSCIGTEAGNTNDRLLNWCLWQATKRKSLLCNLAGIFWYWRQKKVYDSINPMAVVAGIYFKPALNNPFTDYWRN